LAVVVVVRGMEIKLDKMAVAAAVVQTEVVKVQDKDI
jgi:hypothetical protein